MQREIAQTGSRVKRGETIRLEGHRLPIISSHAVLTSSHEGVKPHPLVHGEYLCALANDGPGDVSPKAFLKRNHHCHNTKGILFL